MGSVERKGEIREERKKLCLGAFSSKESKGIDSQGIETRGIFLKKFS